MADAANEMAKIQDKIIDTYTKVVTATREALVSLMDAESRISASEALELGFYTEVAPSMKAVAHFHIGEKPEKVFEKFTKSLTETNKIMSKTMDAIRNLVSALSGRGGGPDDVPKALKITTDTGAVLEFVTSETSPEVGNAVRLDGETAPDGPYTLVTNEVVVVTGGVVETITPVETADPPAADVDEVQRLTDENTRLSAEVADLSTRLEQQNTAHNAELEEVRSMLSDLTETLGSDYTPPPGNFRKPKDGDDEGTPAARALARRRARESGDA